MDISKVIVPAAGISTRFLPFSKSVPRQMLPILRKPALQHIVEEAIASDLSQLYLVNAPGEHSLMGHFDQVPAEDPAGYLEALNKLSKQISLASLTQHEQRGLGYAVWLARHCIAQKEFFGVALPDDLLFGKQPALGQLMRIARQERASVIAVQEVPTECLPCYGVINVKKTITPNLFQVANIIEKPSVKNAPSSLAVVGRYVLTSKIMHTLDSMVTSEEQVDLSEAISNMLLGNERVLAYKVQGTRYDIGTHLGWIKAVISTSLQDPELGPALKTFLADLDTPQSFLYNPAKMIQDNYS